MVRRLAAHLEVVDSPIHLIGSPSAVSGARAPHGQFMSSQPRSALGYCYHAYPAAACRPAAAVDCVWCSLLVAGRGSYTVHQIDVSGCTKKKLYKR